MHNANENITQIKFEFGDIIFTILELCPFTDGKITDFSFPYSNLSLLQPNVIKLYTQSFLPQNSDQVLIWVASLVQF